MSEVLIKITALPPEVLRLQMEDSDLNLNGSSEYITWHQRPFPTWWPTVDLKSVIILTRTERCIPIWSTCALRMQLYDCPYLTVLDVHLLHIQI
jgi:hypothetical protein